VATASSLHIILINRHWPIHRGQSHNWRAGAELDALVTIIEILMRTFATGAAEGRITASLHQDARNLIVWHLQAERAIRRFRV
jgi:hypothetical protein